MENKPLASFLVHTLAFVLDTLVVLALWNWVAVPVGIALPISFGTALLITGLIEGINAVGKYIALKLKER